MTKRAQYMIMVHGIEPDNILMTTFTNKAANEIKERVVKAVGDHAKKLTVGTFHSICNRILRQYGFHLGYTKTFSIIDESDADKIIKNAAKQFGEDAKEIKCYISKCKSNMLTPAKALDGANRSQQGLAQAYQVYQDELKRTQSMDFDDLLLNTVILLENYPEVKTALNNRWKYIMTDECQDSSYLDARLVELLAGKDQNVFFVGDDFQSIYGFRNAEVEIILNLKQRYPNLQWINLANNYRSTETIVNGAKSLIDKNKNQLNKIVNAARDVKGSPIIQTKCKSQEHEAKMVITYIKMLHDKKKLAYKDIAVLYRMTYLSRYFEQELMKEKIPYTIIGGTPFFCRREIVDILSYLKLLVNDRDVMSFKRSIAIPKRGIGEKTIEKIDEFAMNHSIEPMSIRDAISHPELQLKGKAGKGLKEYVEFLDLLETQSTILSVSELIKWLITNLNYVSFLQSEYKEESEVQARVENLMELVNVAKEYDSIEDLLVQASLYREDKDDNEDAVQLLTIHKSKGLEWGAVITPGCAEGILPHHKSITDPAQLEEERRLCYVAMTRAENYLFMTYPSNVTMQGQQVYAKPSRFLNEISSKYVYKN